MVHYNQVETYEWCKLQIFTPWKLRGLQITGSLQGKPVLSMEKGCKNHKETLCMLWMNPVIFVDYVNICSALWENLKSNSNPHLITTSEGTYVEALLYCVFERELCIPSWIEIHTMWAPLLLRLDLECMSKTEKAFNLIDCAINYKSNQLCWVFWDDSK